VSIGGALAEARGQAGLSVTDVSMRTRIRETIIRDIERDEFSTCGGDFYARGHIRAIAKVIDADPAPLIEEYDAAHQPAEELIGGTWTTPDGQRDSAEETATEDWSNSSPPGLDRPSPSSPRTPGISAADAFRPSMPLRAPRRMPGWTVLLMLVLLVVIALLAYLLATGSSKNSGSAATAARHQATNTAHPTQSATGATTPAATPPAAIALHPASAAAFGPVGISDGDNPSGAALALDASTATAWHTDWYATATFAGLKAGTGLLLDMGRQVNITKVAIMLGPQTGADFQLRAGSVATLANLPPIAASTGAGGTVTLQPIHPTAARYLLVWFTRLPPDSAGTFQANVYNVHVTGSS